MPTSEQQPHTTEPEALTDMPELGATEQEQRFRTVAVRVEEAVHAQLSFIADLAGTSLSEEVRRAIDTRIASAQDDPTLIERAQTVRQAIEREAAARSAAIAGFMGQRATAASVRKPRVSGRARTASTNE